MKPARKTKILSREESAAIRERVAKTRLKHLYSNTWTNILATQAVAGAYLVVMSTAMQPMPLLAWLVVLDIVFAWRLRNTHLFHQRMRKKPELTSEQWLWRHRIGVFATGLVLGSSTPLTFPHVGVEYQIFGTFVLAGLSAGALAVMILDRLAFMSYLLCLMVPTSVAFATQPTLLHRAIALMILVYIVVLSEASRKLHRKILDTFILSRENEQLAKKLNEEKKRLDSRLGRILNDSSNEIYIFEADTLRCLQVNQGALDHLGYHESEIGDLTLFDIIADLSSDEAERFLQPLVAGREESVFHHGYHKRKDGSRYPVEVRLQYSARENPPVLVATALDMSEQEKVKDELLHQANFDQLTGLPNRFSMVGRIEHAFFQARQNEKMVALLFLDLDDFKKVNDALGHAAGDTLLQQAARRILGVIRDSDTASRLGGDEFMVMLENIQQSEQAEAVASKLIRAFETPFQIGLSEIYTSVSIGISLFPLHGVSVEELMQYADLAMYQAKQQGLGRHCLFNTDMLEVLEEKLELEAALRRAKENDELSLVYQPKVNARDGRILGAEALLRWHNPALGSISPAHFIPLAETLGIMGEIGAWVLEQACLEAAKWPIPPEQPLRVAVNVSPQQFRSRRLVAQVEEALKKSGMPAHRLELEITESLLLQDCALPLETLSKLRERGIHLSLDDFGTGYSSLSYLKRFPLQTLKIDRSFIRDMTEDENARSLVKAIISMARSLNLDVVAEGVETREQLDLLHRHGVEIIQGYYFSPPVDAERFHELLIECASTHPHFEEKSQLGHCALRG